MQRARLEDPASDPTATLFKVEIVHVERGGKKTSNLGRVHTERVSGKLFG